MEMSAKRAVSGADLLNRSTRFLSTHRFATTAFALG